MNPSLKQNKAGRLVNNTSTDSIILCGGQTVDVTDHTQ